MQFLAAFPTPLQTEQQTLYKATLPGGAETHNSFFIQAVSLQEAGSQALDYSFNVCLLLYSVNGKYNPLPADFPSNPLAWLPPVLIPTMPETQPDSDDLASKKSLYLFMVCTKD